MAHACFACPLRNHCHRVGGIAIGTTPSNIARRFFTRRACRPFYGGKESEHRTQNTEGPWSQSIDIDDDEDDEDEDGEDGDDEQQSTE